MTEAIFTPQERPAAGESLYDYGFELEASPSDVFRLFSDPRKLNALTPRWFQLEIVSPLPEVLDVGATIDYRLRWRGVPLRWRSRIISWDPPYRFIYQQDRGPYRSFRHEHLFRPTDSKQCRVDDRVVFRAPGGTWLGAAVARRDLARIFSHRARTAGALVGGSCPEDDANLPIG